ncbi:quinolinate synthetase, partial [Nitrosococcus oceani C-27]
DVQEKLREYSNAEFLVHPECSCTSSVMYDIASGDYGSRQVQVLSTEGMMSHAKNSPSKQFVVATETGILYRMQKQNPDKEFIPMSENAICKYMKMITLDKVYASLQENKYQVKVPKNIAQKAQIAIERMLAIN